MIDSYCIFCRVIEQNLPSKKEHEDELCVAIHDINPRAKVHLLIIPKKHIATLQEIEKNDEKLLGHLLETASEVAKKIKLDHYKVLINVGAKAGQEVFHLHLHLMSVS